MIEKVWAQLFKAGLGWSGIGVNFYCYLFIAKGGIDAIKL